MIDCWTETWVIPLAPSATEGLEEGLREPFSVTFINSSSVSSVGIQEGEEGRIYSSSYTASQGSDNINASLAPRPFSYTVHFFLSDTVEPLEKDTFGTSRFVLCTVDFTSHGRPVGVAVGNLWLVWLATFILQPMAHTSHKFPAATPTGVPCEVKSTVERLSSFGESFIRGFTVLLYNNTKRKKPSTRPGNEASSMPQYNGQYLQWTPSNLITLI